MKLKALKCAEVRKLSTRALIPRHIVVSIVVCREVGGDNLRMDVIPVEIVEVARKNGYAKLDNPDYVKRVLGIELREGEYMKIIIEGS